MRDPIRSLDPAERKAVARLLGSVRYELLPTAGMPDALESLPRGIAYTITASPRKGLDAGVDLAVEMSRRGLTVVPHLAARMVRDRAHLRGTLERLVHASIQDVFVVAGDGEDHGEYPDGLSLLQAIEAEGVHQLSIGIPGYPDGHPFIDDDTLDEALLAKQGHAAHVTTQMCFDARVIGAWIRRIRAGGVTIPVHIGLAGAVQVARLMKVGARIGVGDSIRFLTKHGGLIRRALAPDYSPTGLLAELASTIVDRAADVAGLHLYTFNQVAETEQWRRALLEALGRSWLE